jgi:hypothetical protein
MDHLGDSEQENIDLKPGSTGGRIELEFIEEDTSQEEANVAITDPLGNFSDQTGALFG